MQIQVFRFDYFMCRSISMNVEVYQNCVGCCSQGCVGFGDIIYVRIDDFYFYFVGRQFQ